MEWFFILFILALIFRGALRRSFARRSFNQPQSRQRAQRFYHAVLRLAAKIAKVDGSVSPAEIRAFKTSFPVDPSLLPNAAQIFNDAVHSAESLEDVANDVLHAVNGDPDWLLHVLSALARVTLADGTLSTSEREALQVVCTIFRFHPGVLDMLLFGRSSQQSRAHAPAPSKNARDALLKLLQLPKTATQKDVRSAYRRFAARHHPDALRAKGLPPEQVKNSEDLMKQVNAAYDDAMRAAA